MKSGLAYATRLKKAYAKFRQAVPNPQIPELDDPLHRLAVGILGVRCSDEEAYEAIERMLATLIDWNEIRVSRPLEIQRAIGKALPEEGLRRIQRLLEALQDVYDRENCLSLDRLASLGRREARQYLEGLRGVDEYAVASVVLWSLGGHAIPVNDRLLAALQEADLVHPTATRAEVQAFLERHIGAAKAKDFCIAMTAFPAPKRAAEQRRKAVAPSKSDKRSTS